MYIHIQYTCNRLRTGCTNVVLLVPYLQYKLFSKHASYVFSLVASETGWSECSKTCGGGEKFKMVNNVKQVLPCNTLPCPGWNLLIKYNCIYCLIPKYMCSMLATGTYSTVTNASSTNKDALEWMGEGGVGTVH